MNCLTCKKEIDQNDANNLIDNKIQLDSNCFPYITYTDEKVIFKNIFLDDGENEKTCLDYGKAIIQGEFQCVTKEDNYYYVLKNEENTGVIKKCDESCATCNDDKNEDTQDTNCIDCAEGYFKTEDSNTNCIKENLIPENYFKYNDNIYYKCHSNCKRCDGFYDTNENNMNCLECIENYYFVNGTKNCYNLTFVEENEYYFSTSDTKFYKCYFSCSLCDKAEEFDMSANEIKHNCIKCANNYYPLRNYIDNYDPQNGNYLMCYSEETIIEGYFLNKSDIFFVWEECYERCATCTYKGNDDKMACLSCKTHYIENEFNKLVYLKLNKKNNCIIACPPDLYLTYELDCVSSCLNGNYAYMPNYTCLNSCPDNFVVNSENNACIFSSLKNETSISFFNEIIYSNISYFADDSNKVLDFSDFKALITPVRYLDPVEQIKNGISGLDFGDCIKH